MLFGSCTIAIALSCMAESAPVKPNNVESLINRNKWKEASRAIFLEARSVDKFEWSIPAGQARAGFLEDALDTIADVAPNSQPGALLALVADVPSIPPEKKAELVKAALDMARKGSGKSSNYSRSGDLTGVALFYARTGAVPESRVVFEEALRCAESGIGEKGSGAYRRVTETMARESTGNQDWMIQLAMQHLQRAGKTADSAYSYLDLAQVAVRLQRKSWPQNLLIWVSRLRRLSIGRLCGNRRLNNWRMLPWRLDTPRGCRSHPLLPWPFKRQDPVILKRPSPSLQGFRRLYTLIPGWRHTGAFSTML